MLNHSKTKFDKDNIIQKFMSINEGRKYPVDFKDFCNLTGYNRFTIIYIFGSYSNLVSACGYRHSKEKQKLTEEFLLDELLRFIAEEGKIPTGADLESSRNKGGYPNRKTYSNHFGSVKKALIKLGVLSDKLYERILQGEKIVMSELTEDEVDNLKTEGVKFLQNFQETYGRTPTTKELDSGEYGCFTRSYFRNIFGSYSEAVKIAGLKPNSIPQYDDDFLKQEFERFVNEKGRIPKMQEFNNNRYPSFCCYQARFGSWNKAIMYYGYKPNDANRKFYMDDGEVCESSYEFDISKWLKQNKITYERNVPYVEIHDTYKGKMDCDYKIIHNNKVWYVEMAGFLSDSNRLSEIERVYYFKIKYKEKLLKEAGCNYIIIKPRDIKNKTMEEIFKQIKN